MYTFTDQDAVRSVKNASLPVGADVISFDRLLFMKRAWNEDGMARDYVESEIHDGYWK